MKETDKLRKGYKLQFLTNDKRQETIISTYKPNDIESGEIVTDKNTYSVAFLQNWKERRFLKIYV